MTEPFGLVIDSHNDSIVSHIRRGNLSLTGRGTLEPPGGIEGTVLALRGPLSAAERARPAQLDFRKMREGGIDAAFFAVDVTRARHNHLAYALDALAGFRRDAEAHPGEIEIALSAGDLQRARAAGRPAALLVIENSDALDGSLNLLHAVHRLGVRSLTLTHNPTSLAAAGNGERESGGGLTRFGRALVGEMERLRMLVDVSHLAERGFWDTLEIAGRPVIASHSCCAALCPHPRNLTDRQLAALAERGGVVGITFVPSFVDADAPSFERLLDHIEHAVRVAGADHVGIGSDFDGGGDLLESAAEFPRLRAGLLARGHPPEVVRGIMGENHFRLIREVLG